MKKFILGFLIGSLIFGGSVFARDKIVDFSEASVELLNEIVRKVWFQLDDKAVRDDTPSYEFHDTDTNKAFMIHYDSAATTDWVWALYYGQDYVGSTFNIDATYRKPFLGFAATGGVFMPYIKTGTTQAAAGAVTGEIFADSDDGFTLKIAQ